METAQDGIASTTGYAAARATTTLSPRVALVTSSSSAPQGSVEIISSDGGEVQPTTPPAPSDPILISVTAHGAAVGSALNEQSSGMVGPVAYFGEPGSMSVLPYITTRKTQVERPTKMDVTIGGRRVAYASRLARRSWTATVQGMRGPELGALAEKMQVGPGPFLWIDPVMQVTNMLTPSQGALESAALSGSGWSPDGRMDTEDGPSWTSVAIKPGGILSIPRVPVRESQQSTVSVYVDPGSGSSFRMWIDYYDQTGSRYISSSPEREVVRSSANTSGVASRESLSDTAPPGASFATIGMLVQGDDIGRVSRPALTWTPGPLEWSSGQGVAAVICSGWSGDTRSAYRGPREPRTTNVSFTLEEVG